MLRVQVGVHVVQQPVAQVNGLARSGGDLGPEVKLLVRRANVGVVAVERVPGAERGPALAEDRIGGKVEAAHVGADHGNLVHGDVLNHLHDLEAVVFVVGAVVTEPVASKYCQNTDNRGRGENW